MGDAGMPKSLADSLESTKVSYVQLGASGLRVSIPILGAMSFGTYKFLSFLGVGASETIVVILCVRRRSGKQQVERIDHWTDGSEELAVPLSTFTCPYLLPLVNLWLTTNFFLPNRPQRLATLGHRRRSRGRQAPQRRL